MKSGVNPATWMLEVTGGAISVSTKAVEVSERGNWAGDRVNKAEVYGGGRPCVDQGCRGSVNSEPRTFPPPALPHSVIFATT